MGVRGDGLLVGLRNGSVFGADRATVERNTLLRRLQVRTIAVMAMTSTNPVIIAGDTNLPDPSRILAEDLRRWRDGFDAVGLGFGCTYPLGNRRPWMRIDRILAGPGLRFVSFTTGSGHGSDHRCVWAGIEFPGAAER